MAIASCASRLRSAFAVYRLAILEPLHPKIAFNCATVAPLFAALVAPILRNPCADFLTPACLQASEKALPNDSLVIGLPLMPQMKANSAVGPARKASCNGANRGMWTSVPVFCVRIVATPVPDMLLTKAHRIATSQTGVHQHSKPDALPRSERPLGLIGGNVLLAPDREAFARFQFRIFDALSRVDLHEACLFRPCKKATHRVEEVPCLEKSLGATVAASRNNGGRNRRVGTISSGCDHLLEDVLALAARRQG